MIGEKAPMAQPATGPLLLRMQHLERRVAKLEGQHAPAVPKAQAIPLCEECGEGAGLVSDHQTSERVRLVCVRCDVKAERSKQ